MGSPVEQAAVASKGTVSSMELLHFRMVTLKTDFWGSLVSHFPVSHLLLLVTGSYPYHHLQSADCASLKKYIALLGCVSSTLVGGDRNRPFMPNRILIHRSSCKGLGLPPQKVNWSLYVIKTAVLTFFKVILPGIFARWRFIAPTFSKTCSVRVLKMVNSVE